MIKRAFARILEQLADFASTFEGARMAAIAVRAGRRPHPDTLRRLQIDRAAFDRIHY